MSLAQAIREFTRLFVEAKVREADLTGGGRAPFGSRAHIRDLKARIKDAESWRNKHRRGTEARANYSRIVTRLRAELRAAERRRRPVNEAAKWWQDPATRDPDGPGYVPPNERFARMATEPEYAPYIQDIVSSVDPRALAAAKRRVQGAIDAGETDMPDGMWLHFYDARREELLRSPAVRTDREARADRVLRTRDSDGRARARKW